MALSISSFLLKLPQKSLDYLEVISITTQGHFVKLKEIYDEALTMIE